MFFLESVMLEVFCKNCVLNNFEKFNVGISFLIHLQADYRLFLQNTFRQLLLPFLRTLNHLITTVMMGGLSLSPLVLNVLKQKQHSNSKPNLIKDLVCVVCVCVSRLKQNNECNARDQASNVVLKKLLCQVPSLPRH